MVRSGSTILLQDKKRDVDFVGAGVSYVTVENWKMWPLLGC